MGPRRSFSVPRDDSDRRSGVAQGHAPGVADVIVFSQAGALPEAGLEELIEAVEELDMAEVHAEIAKQQAGAAEAQ
ncbi:hypothetical protein [Tessaracoccus massiliensis]|uniref:hypothetical protein n=1 Tax=Tessaracoccus massiliensis TaxID=1522311 RepID=UPI0015D62E78|nr:hypothetical protein [Tessaracoccus massiliensis]